MEPNTPETTPVNKNWIIGIIIVVVLIVAWLLFSGGSKQAIAPSDTSQTAAQTSTQNPTTQTTIPATPIKKTSTTPTKSSPAVQEINPNPTATNPQTLTVIFTGGSFSPDPITIKKGYAIMFVNKGETSMWIASDPYGIYPAYSGLDEKASVGSDGSYSFTFNKVGSWSYYNKLNPAQKGTIIVQP